jgi:alanyl-tRNA synthetase
VLRRLIRRSLTTLWRDDPALTLSDLPTGLLEQTLEHFGQGTDAGQVRQVLRDEEQRFAQALVRGRKVMSRRSGGPLSEEEFRYLHDTHGLPRELVIALLPDVQ